MKFKAAFPVLFLFICSGLPLAQATTVTLSVTPNPATYGAAMTLIATVSPAASGTVAFYDGATIIGVAPVSGATAAFGTRQLLSGARKLVARYAGAVSAPVTETVNAAPASAFNPVSAYPVGPPAAPGSLAAEQSPQWLAVGDFNGDGKLDAVLPVYAASTGTNSQIALMLGSGTGSFQSPVYITGGVSITSVAVGDFNGDGKLDLVVTDAGGGTNPVVPPSVNILIGNGNGTFLTPSIFPLTVAGYNPYRVIVGDFNLDGKEDVAVSNQNGSSDVSILLGNGNGTLNAAVNYATGTSVGAFGLALGDYNGDGIPDIAVAEDVVVILTGRGDGTFAVGSTNMVGTSPNDIQAADFNGDGKADLVVASGFDNQISVLLGNGNGTFAPEAIYSVGSTPESITIADLNGDGKQDLAVANSDLLSGDSPPLGSISVLIGNGDGTFQPAANYSTGPAPVTVVQGDFTGMGSVDLATADYGDGTGVNPGDLGVLLSAGCVTGLFLNGPTSINSSADTVLAVVNTTNSSCTWTATSSVPWITVTPPTGTGSENVAMSVSQNTTGQDRSGTVSIGGHTVNFYQAFTTGSFSDVVPSNYFYDAVNLLAARGITTGCAPSQYCPLADVTRAQMAVFIVRSVYGSDNFAVSPTQHFVDVGPSTFGYQWIQKMYELGITTGCSEPAPGVLYYCPTSTVSRDQMAVFIIRARYGTNTNFTYNPAPTFTDVPVTEFAFKWIQRMAEDGITTGCSATTYCPGSPVTRGDMAIFLMRGGFNEVLPNPAAPVISSVTPTTLAPGASATFTITGTNVSFIEGTTVVAPVYGSDPANGVTASNVTLISPTQLTVTLTASPSAPAQPYSIYVQTGAAEAVLPNGIVVP